jgi:hypothetical protein
MMRKVVFLLLLLAAMVLAPRTDAQKMTTLQLAPGGTTTLTRPLSALISADDLRVKPSHEADTSILLRKGGNAAIGVPQPSPGSVSPPAANPVGFSGISHLDQRFAGTGAYVNTQFSTEPPDQGLAAGNGFVVEAVNSALAVYDQHTGTRLLGPTPVNQFFQRTPEINRTTGIRGDFLADPRVLYDHETRRWFVTVVEIDVNPITGAFATHSRLLLAVSQTDDPTLIWNLFSLDVTDDGSNGTQTHPGCPCFGDQPLIGADRNGFYISTNEFGITSPAVNFAQIYAMDKEALTDGLLPHVVHISSIPFPEGFPFSIQPAFSTSSRDFRGDWDEGEGRGVEYFMSVPFVNILDNRIVVWALGNTSSLKHSNPDLQLSHVVLQSENYGIPADAAQEVGPTPLGTLLGEPEELLSTGDYRMQQVVFADGKLWSGITTSVSQGPNCTDGFETDCKTGIAWFVVEPHFWDDGLEARIRRQGYVSVLGNNVFYPSIGVTDEGKGVMTFTLSGTNYFPSSAYVRINEDRVSSIRIAAQGVAPDDGFTGYPEFGGAGSGRWGDYSAAVADGDTIWFACEFIPGGPRTQLANWGTFIGHLGTDDEGEGDR